MIRSIPLAKTQCGFTLLEVMLALLSFSLLLTIGYGAIVSTAEGRNRVLSKVDRQESLRVSHRTITNAVAAGGRIKGSHQRIRFDLLKADSSWLVGSDTLTLTITSQGQLLAQDSQQLRSSVLMDDIGDARFIYHDAGLNHRQWDKPDSPEWVELRWYIKGQQSVWRFVSE